MIEFNKELLKLEARGQTVNDATEVLRSQIIKNAKFGDILAIKMGSYMPDWKGPFNCDLFDPNIIFNFQAFR